MRNLNYVLSVFLLTSFCVSGHASDVLEEGVVEPKTAMFYKELSSAEESELESSFVASPHDSYHPNYEEIVCILSGVAMNGFAYLSTEDYKYHYEALSEKSAGYICHVLTGIPFDLDSKPSKELLNILIGMTLHRSEHLLTEEYKSQSEALSGRDGAYWYKILDSSL